MNLIQKIKAYFAKRKREKEFKKRIAEIRKRDPFNYKNF
tara:strand:+ start:51 stop:167 length:117 start_codon:yes stop_codon:yes gene_type:complete